MILEEAAQRRGVSLNAEIVRRLEESFRLEQALERAEQGREDAERKMYEMMDVIIRLSRSLPLGDAPREKGQSGGIRLDMAPRGSTEDEK